MDLTIRASTIPQNDKGKCHRNLQLIFHYIMGFESRKFVYSKHKLVKDEIILTAKRLERKLYDRVFSYFQPFSKGKQSHWLLLIYQERVAEYLERDGKQFLMSKVMQEISSKSMPQPAEPGLPTTLTNSSNST